MRLYVWKEFGSRQKRAYGQGGFQSFVRQEDSGFDFPGSPLFMKPLSPSLRGQIPKVSNFHRDMREFSGVVPNVHRDNRNSLDASVLLMGFSSPSELDARQNGDCFVRRTPLKGERDGCWRQRRCGVGPLRLALFLPAPIFSRETGNVPSRFCQEGTS